MKNPITPIMNISKFVSLQLILFFLLIKTNELFSQSATLEATLSLKQSSEEIQIPFQNGFVLPTFEKQNRSILNLAGAWKKKRFTANNNYSLNIRDAAGYNNLLNEVSNYHLQSFDDSGWESKQLPAVENTINTFPAPPELLPNSSQPSGVWYRKTFQVDAANAGKFVKLIFYSVNYIADVWINGQYVGYHEGGYTPFAFDVSSKLNYGGSNLIAIRVDNPEWGKRLDIVPYVVCDWFNYTGVIHDMYLEFSDQISVARTDIVPKDINGNIQTTVILQNKSGSAQNADLKIQVYEADVTPWNIKDEISYNLIGVPVSVEGTTDLSFSINKDSLKVFRTNLKVLNPKLWTPLKPNLYIMKVSVYQSGVLKDEYATQFGIRTITQSGAQVLLNGKPVFFTGVARHEDHPIYGRSIPIDTIYTDLTRVQLLNANLLRTAHYPNHPYTYLITDRLGIAVVEEIPVWQFNDSKAWMHQNNVRHIHEQMFKEMVFKDYNRPSVFFWSTSNECDNYTGDASYRKVYNQKVNNDLDNNYPDGRLITQSAAANMPGPQDDSQNATDVAGWTMYFGIFHGTGLDFSYYLGTKDFLESAHQKFPNKPILNTEFGYWSTENPNNITYQKQIDVFNDTFRALKEKAVLNSDGSINNNGFLIGTTWWCIFDWYQYKNNYNSYQTMGLISMNRQTTKPVGNTLKAAYSPYFNIGGMTSVKENSSDKIPDDYRLMQNYPNPFNPTTVISYQLPSAGHVSLKIFDLLGQEVATVVNEFQQAGFHSSQFSIINLPAFPSGIYFYRLITDKYSSTRKMVLIK